MPQQTQHNSHLGTLSSNLDGHHSVNVHCRIVVLGSAKVGKTAIVEQFLYETFPVIHCATVEQLYRAQYDVKGTQIGTLTLDILDTSGSYEFPAMRQLAIKSANAFILVYSIDDNESYEEVIRLRDMIVQTKQINSNNINNNTINETSPAIVVVANKCDLSDKRVIRKELAETVVCLDWENGYVECSAKDNNNVIKIFQELMTQTRVPYDVGPTIANGKHRRTSLPEHPMSPINRKIREIPKRNSCPLS